MRRDHARGEPREPDARPARGLPRGRGHAGHRRRAVARRRGARRGRDGRTTRRRRERAVARAREAGFARRDRRPHRGASRRGPRGAGRRPCGARPRARPDHVSVYLLESDKDTPLGRGARSGRRARRGRRRARASVRGDGGGARGAGLRALRDLELRARTGDASRHNLKYWTDEPYGGFGLGAHALRRRASGGRTAATSTATSRDLAAGRDPVVWNGSVGRRAAPVGGPVPRACAWRAGSTSRRSRDRYGIDARARFAAAWERASEAGCSSGAGASCSSPPPGRLRSNELFSDLV